MSFQRFRKQGLIHFHSLIVFILFAFFLIHTPLYAADPSGNYTQILIKQAKKEGLAQTRVWHLLLHYKKDLFGNIEGQEDGPDFYNAPRGKYDPEAELAATLDSFFKSKETLKAEEEHPQCNFPARYKWLERELSFDPKQLPKQRCPRLEGWLNNLNPKSITIVFSSFYMNNPASMFGHTLLRIDTKRDNPDQKLLNYGVNYAATLDTDNALFYVVKGLFGFFKGEFALFPYYVKVQTYSNMESRDLWEYELNFSEDQMQTFLLHLWELGGNYFDYYYFQENCSYHILSLLEVANPELHLSDQFWFHVIPSDTVKAFTRYENLVSKVVYRPSLLSKMSQKKLQMTAEQEALLQTLVKDPTTALNSDRFQLRAIPEKALILDAFLDYAQYKNMRAKKEDGDSILVKNRDALLARSKLGFRFDNQAQVAFSTRPEFGHGSDRLKIGLGAYNNKLFEEIAYRPAYHDLLAKDVGFGKGSQILFLDVVARYYKDIEETKIDRLSLIDIVSLTPYDRLFQKKSWRFSIGVDTIKDFDCGFCNSFKTHYGYGLTYKSSPFSALTIYSLLDVELEMSSRLKSDYRAGGGGTLGLYYDPVEDWRIQVFANYMGFPIGHNSEYYRVAVNQRYAVSQNFDLRLELSQIKKNDEWLFSLNYYF